LFTTGDAHILFLLWPCRWALSKYTKKERNK
jgi:hypothetical protein